MIKPKVIMWVFMPNESERSKEWAAPSNYIRAAAGEVRIKLATDTPLNDHSFFEPGWHKVNELEKVYDLDLSAES